MSFHFLTQYQLEIIAILIVILFVVIYFLFKKSPKTKDTLLEIQPAVVDEYESQHPKTTTDTQDIYDIDFKEEEKKEEEHEIEEKTDEIKEKSSSKQFHKKVVPPHGKIKKEDFSKFKGKRILLAEDNIINQKVILGLLGESGMEIVVANDGQEVLNILENDTNFMLILMDAHMPNIDGFEATKIIRKNEEYDHIVVIALSGDTASDDVKKMKDAGMSETLAKPLNMDALYDILYAYNTQETQKPKEVIEDTSTDTILDTQEGLGVCGDDREFYKEILNEFIADYQHSDEALSILLKENKINEADNLLLDIMGVSSNLGATALYNIAKNIKELLKEENRISQEKLQQYSQTLKQTLKAIHEYIEK